MEPLKTTEEIAEYLRVEIVTVRRLVMRGELPAYRIGGELRFIASEVEEAVKSQRVTSRDVVDAFGKFTQRCREVLNFADEEAAKLNHHYIGTEHLLLGIVHEGKGVAAIALERSGLDLNNVRERMMQLLELVPPTEPHTPEGPGAQLKAALQNVLSMARASQPCVERGLTKRAKKVIELGVDEARRQGHHYIGTEHLLLGILREGEGLAARVLIQGCGLQLDPVRELVVQILQEPAATKPLEPEPPV